MFKFTIKFYSQSYLLHLTIKMCYNGRCSHQIIENAEKYDEWQEVKNMKTKNGVWEVYEIRTIKDGKIVEIKKDLRKINNVKAWID